MNILDEILAFKAKEVAARRESFPIKQLEKSMFFGRDTFSMSEHIQRSDKWGIIAEIKRQSPSKGVINAKVSVQRTSVGYEKAGASALSILTDSNFFGGSNEDLSVARKLNLCPILRKDFTIDEYQIIEAKSIGADAILLIAAALAPDVIHSFVSLAHSLSLEVLLEVHNEKELKENVSSGADLMGVNNRNLKTFELNVDTSRKLASLIPKNMLRISESGIESVKTIMDLKQYGYKGFLMGQNFMQHTEPEVACREFIDELKVENSKFEKRIV
ncbi:MAG: indole-3-glycerol phosphate synthase TrpC [Chryseolinea sp.]